ncbi:MAG: hypothetical protein ABFR65_13080, partial [Pseudomonadota bacterium]
VLQWVYQSPERKTPGTGQLADSSTRECGDQLQTQVHSENTTGGSLSHPVRTKQAGKQQLRTAAIERDKSQER